MFHVEIWELYVELYIKRWVFKLKHPIFASAQTQIFDDLTPFWLWLVKGKEFIVITTHGMEGT